MKTLIVKYLPSTRSRTRKLLEAFLEGISDSEIEELDLCTDVPDLFSVDALVGQLPSPVRLDFAPCPL